MKLLLENHPHDIDIQELSDSQYLFDIAFPDGGVEYIDAYRQSKNIDDDIEDDDIEDSKDFIYWLKDILYEYMSDFDGKLEDLINNDNTIEIWREITSDDKFISKLKTDDKIQIGEYWSWDEHAAEAHWGKHSKHKHTIVFHGLVHIKYIDWTRTYEVNSTPINFEEREINILKNSPIKLLGFTVDGKYNKLPKYMINTKFTA